MTLFLRLELSLNQVKSTTWRKHAEHLIQSGIAVGPVVKGRNRPHGGEGVIVKRDGLGRTLFDCGRWNSFCGPLHHRGARIHPAHRVCPGGNCRFESGTGAAADIENPVTGAYPGEGHQILVPLGVPLDERKRP
jgi:hypothetical protein